MEFGSLNVSLSSISCLSEECSQDIRHANLQQIEFTKTLFDLFETQAVDKEDSESSEEDFVERDHYFQNQSVCAETIPKNCSRNQNLKSVHMDSLDHLANSLSPSEHSLELQKVKGQLEFGGRNFFEFRLWSVF